MQAGKNFPNITAKQTLINRHCAFWKGNLKCFAVVLRMGSISSAKQYIVSYII